MKTACKFIIGMAIFLIAAVSCKETENNVAVTDFTLSESAVTLLVGETETVTAALTPANATEPLLWTSSNPGTATVLGGVVTALLPGTATITASTLDGKIQKSFTVTVIVVATGITIGIKDLELAYQVNEQEALPYTFTPIQALNTIVTWTSSDPNVATVDAATGVVTAMTKGTAIITAWLEDGESDFCNVTTRDISVYATGVALNIKSLRLVVGQQTNLAFTISPADATVKKVKWSSDAPDVAKVDAFTGEITAVSAGTANIVATTVDGGFTDKCTMEILNMPPNLLLNPGFEDPDNGVLNGMPPNWTQIPATWFTAYYSADPLGPGNAPPNNTNNMRSDVAFFTTGNGVDIADVLTGKYTARIPAAQAGGSYQIVNVTPGEIYEYGCDIAFRLNNISQQTIKNYETLKILSPDGLTLYGEAPIDVDNAEVNGAGYIIKGVNGIVVIPDDVTQVRFQVDQRNFNNPNAAPVMCWDECYFRWVP